MKMSGRSGIAACLIFAGGCVAPTFDALESTTVVLGPSGGTAKSADGHFRLTVAAGALGADQPIVIATVRTTFAPEQRGPAYEVQLERELDVPVRIALDVAAPSEPSTALARIVDGTAETTESTREGDALVIELDRVVRSTWAEIDVPESHVFTCQSSALTEGDEPVAITRLPGVNGAADLYAVLVDLGTKTRVVVESPLLPGVGDTVVLEDELPMAIYGFEPEPGRSALAVVTRHGGFGSAWLWVFEWNGAKLLPHDGTDAPGTPLEIGCGRWMCAAPIAGDDCHPRVEAQTDVSIRTRDLDGDGKLDLLIGNSADLPIITFFTGGAPAGAMFASDACTCGRYAQAPNAFELLETGTTTGTGPSLALVIGAPGGAFVRYGDEDTIACGQPVHIGGLSPVRDLARGHLHCNGSGCSAFEDLVLVQALQLGGGSFDDPGVVRVAYGTAELWDGDMPPTGLELLPTPISGAPEPRDPRTVLVGDVDRDGRDDVVVLYRSTTQVHTWLSGGDHLSIQSVGIDAATCDAPGTIVAPCDLHASFALTDLDGDGAKDIVALCNATSGHASIRRFTWR